MSTTLNLIAKQTVGSGGASSVTFSNIPQTFTDLKVVMSVRDGSAQVGNNILFQINGGTTSQSVRAISGDGSSTPNSYSATPLFFTSNGNSSTANTFSNMEVYICNYASTTINKSVSVDSVSENNGTTAYAQLTAGLYASNTAITSILFTANGGPSFSEFSEFWLYGISSSSTQNTSIPLASGGDVIATDGTYWYHAFKSSGSFVPIKNLTADVLAVAGGGGGGLSGIPPYSGAGGGGAGGVLAFSSQSLTTSTNYTCLVGGGGNAGSNGSNSQFSSLTASVGGGNGGTGYNTTTSGGNGGSGGGGGGNVGSPGGGGSATSGQGNAGASGTNSASEPTGGGGGGAGSAGSTGNASVGGAGGAGLNSVTNWGALSAVLTATTLGSSGYLAGGGGGAGWNQPISTSGAGGTGGGGAGSPSNNASGFAGLANTGGGGGGNSIASPTGNGGSGLVIVRYPVL